MPYFAEESISYRDFDAISHRGRGFRHPDSNPPSAFTLAFSPRLNAGVPSAIHGKSAKRETDIDISASSIRIRTDLMGGIDEPLCVGAIQSRKTYFELCCNAKPSL
jgi:hypothetical protein